MMTVGTHSIAESDPRFPSHRHVDHLARPAAHELIADCHQMLFNLEWEWGPVLRWKHLFIEELNELQRSGFANAERWFGQLRGRVSAGEGILEHLAHIMDSELPQDIEELRHIWRQTNELTKLVSFGVSGLQHGLDIVVMQYQRQEGNLFSVPGS